MADFITVQSTSNDQRVCLHEFDAVHPNGEVWIVNDGTPHKVALTAGISQRLQNGALVEVQHKSKKSTEPEQPVEPVKEPEQPIVTAEDEPAKRGRKPSK